MKKVCDKYMKKIRFLFFLILVLFGGIFIKTPVYAAKVSLNKTSISLVEQEKTTLKLLHTSRPVTWSSSNPVVASVSASGVVTAKKTGFSTIMATCNHKVYRCFLTVKSQKPIVLAGSSTLDFWPSSSKAFYPYRNVNMGIAGIKVSPWYRKLYKPLIIEQDPLAVIIYVGANDITTNTSGLGLKTGTTIVKFLQLLHKELPNVPIFYISINPAPKRAEALPEIQKCNTYVRKNCRKIKNVFYLDTNSSFLKNGTILKKYYRPDNLHLTEEGYQILQDIVRTAVLDRLK